MPISIHSTSIGVMTRMLTTLSAMLDTAVTYAQASRLDPATLLEARLAPDMHNFVRQVQMATDTAKFAGARLAGMIPPSFLDTETSFPELQARIDKTLRFLEIIDPLEVEASSSRIVTIQHGSRSVSYRGPDYLRQFALPNFYFHVTTAYAILRTNRVPLGKLDYLGAFPTDGASVPVEGRRIQYG
ncbi:MAG: DUF1993 domain-containing protein [Rhizobiaceae bacterium]|nr:DUF1993 domain-containing protein [Rhizobiaceae bacterium]